MASGFSADPKPRLQGPLLQTSSPLKHQMQRTIEAHAPEYLRNIVKVITETGLRI
jgi:hypothetical protein